MKRWALVTMALYGLLLILLSVPVLLIGWLKWFAADQVWRWDISASEVFELFQSWGYWVWLGIMVAAQGLLLFVPVDVSERRPTARRRLIVPVVVSTFLLANLFLAGLFAILSAAMGDEVSKVIETPAKLAADVTQVVPGLGGALARLGLTPGNDWFILLHLFGWILVFWLVWGLVFYHFSRTDDGESLTRRASRWLLRGSILELLVAVPSHIIVRHRDDCCAPMLSFWGIVTGLSVMLVSFGPGVFFLFAARIRQRQPRPASSPVP
jgi:hypothetical protein